ncbi:MAG TPA: hypothetical protein VD996_16770 [Chitinophagaceae bacterium]|nr:hypothetical protein [Chitinophagaceae bacterium]
MWKKANYKQKLWMLAGAGLLVLVLCYRLSIANTVEQYRLYRANTTLSGNAGAEGLSIKNLEARERMLNGIMERYLLDTLNQQANLLNIVGRHCREQNLKLKEYKPYPVSGADSIETFTRMLTVEGRFIDCLKLVHALETKYKAGRVASVYFKSFSGANEQNTFLHCTIYVQNLIPDMYAKN